MVSLPDGSKHTARIISSLPLLSLSLTSNCAAELPLTSKRTIFLPPPIARVRRDDMLSETMLTLAPYGNSVPSTRAGGSELVSDFSVS